MVAASAAVVAFTEALEAEATLAVVAAGISAGPKAMLRSDRRAGISRAIAP
jgi:hypothetical protein